MTWFYLSIAIISEVIATSALKLSDSFTRLWPSLVTVLGYGVAFYFLAVSMRTLPIGIIYAIWSGTGIVLIGIVGWLYMGQKLDLPAMLGMGLIIAGVMVINLFSHTVSH
ncbi:MULTISPECIES: DMT family transporter [Mangrovibacter]|uniref:Small multidrug resistance pump n=1 Tax=Mangrovibacter plantisponsor TaxID=451513 RepID=A0A317Q6B9_9ENTR|nr:MULTISPECIES: SMR family transporter [Mangrovibacter]KEA50993.1 multidrug transporter [Mangrovibacter sp. MFB070]PWW10812.1 small multidrug resistance pump [Mangrovibacter plantisponsor]